MEHEITELEARIDLLRNEIQVLTSAGGDKDVISSYEAEYVQLLRRRQDLRERIAFQRGKLDTLRAYILKPGPAKAFSLKNLAREAQEEEDERNDDLESDGDDP